MTEGNKPKNTIRIGGIKVTTWENQSEKGSFLTHNVARSYKDKKGEWKETGSFPTADLPKLILALQKAYEAGVIKEKE